MGSRALGQKVETDGFIMIQITLILVLSCAGIVFGAPADTTIPATTPAQETTSSTEPPEMCDMECPNADADGGFFPDGDCSPDFCECVLGNAFMFHCPGVLIFNPALEVCDWPFNVEGCAK